ncbi:hypothetical protein S245_013822, partial [Arachis hypogaea]
WDIIPGHVLIRRLMLQLRKMKMHNKHLKQVSLQQEKLCHSGAYKTCQTQSRRYFGKKPWMQLKRSSPKATHSLKMMK